MPEAVEREIAALAGRQHGVVSRKQLLSLGLGGGAIEWRIRRGRLHAIHRGVYLLGHDAATRRSHEIAAVLGCGPSAVLSHRSAASFWKLLPYLPNSDAPSVTVRGRNRQARPGIRVHRAPSLARRDWVTRDAIPVTTPARTILDLAATASGDELERAVAQGLVLRLVSERQLRDQLERNPRRSGTGALRRLLEGGEGSLPTRSEAERRMLGLLRSAGLPTPEANVRLGGHEVDFLWRGAGIAIEVDGYRFHSDRRSFERDRVRDGELAAIGYTVLRVTWRQLDAEPEAVAARVAAALAVRR